MKPYSLALLVNQRIWMMRQAGRYLPEYKATRAQAGGFLDLCYNPDLATEVTLQPIRRFGFDAAILFADILLVPQALGMKLWFETGEGPRLTPVSSADELKAADDIHDMLSPVYETVGRLAAELPQETTLIGFAGAPWTVATYMIAGQGTIGVELAAQCPDLAAVYVCVGGGGLISGIGAYLKAMLPEADIVGCWPENAPAMHGCLEKGEIRDVP